jgi:hypothetical protein
MFMILILLPAGYVINIPYAYLAGNEDPFELNFLTYFQGVSLFIVWFFWELIVDREHPRPSPRLRASFWYFLCYWLSPIALNGFAILLRAREHNELAALVFEHRYTTLWATILVALCFFMAQRIWVQQRVH